MSAAVPAANVPDILPSAAATDAAAPAAAAAAAEAAGSGGAGGRVRRWGPRGISLTDHSSPDPLSACPHNAVTSAMTSTVLSAVISAVIKSRDNVISSSPPPPSSPLAPRPR